MTSALVTIDACHQFVLVDEIDYVWLVEGVSCGLVVSGQAMVTGVAFLIVANNVLR